jgi:hypothetical protein
MNCQGMFYKHFLPSICLIPLRWSRAYGIYKTHPSRFYGLDGELRDINSLLTPRRRRCCSSFTPKGRLRMKQWNALRLRRGIRRQTPGGEFTHPPFARRSRKQGAKPAFSSSRSDSISTFLSLRQVHCPRKEDHLMRTQIQSASYPLSMCALSLAGVSFL